MPSFPGSPVFKGTLSEDGEALAGDFTQGGGTGPFKLSRTADARMEPRPKSTPISADLEGNWEGTLDIQGKVMLRLNAKLARQPDRTGGGTLVSMDQGGVEISIPTFIQKGTHVTLLLPSIVAQFEGDLKHGELHGPGRRVRGSFLWS